MWRRSKRASSTARAPLLARNDRARWRSAVLTSTRSSTRRRIVRARVEPGALTRGVRARVIVDLVQEQRGRDLVDGARSRAAAPDAAAAGGSSRPASLPGISPTFVRRSPSDVRPSGTRRGAASPGRRRAARGLRQRARCSATCWRRARRSAAAMAVVASPGASAVVDDVRYDARADRVTIHRTGPDRARLEVALTIREAVRTKAKPGWARADTSQHRHAPRGAVFRALAAGEAVALGPTCVLGVRRAERRRRAQRRRRPGRFTDVPSLSERPVPADVPEAAQGLGASALPARRRVRGAAAGSRRGRGWAPRRAVGPAGRGRAGDRRRRGRVVTAWHRRAGTIGCPRASRRWPTARWSSSETSPATAPCAPCRSGPTAARAALAQVVGQVDGTTSDDGTCRVVPGPPGGVDRDRLARTGSSWCGSAPTGGGSATAAMGTRPVLDRPVPRAAGRHVAGARRATPGLEIRARRRRRRPVGHVGRAGAAEARLRDRGGRRSPRPSTAACWSSGSRPSTAAVRRWPRGRARVGVRPSRAGGDRAGDRRRRSAGERRRPARSSANNERGRRTRCRAAAGGSRGAGCRRPAAASCGPRAWTPRARRPWHARRVTQRLADTALGRAGFGLAGDTVAFIAWPEIAGLPQVRAAPLP